MPSRALYGTASAIRRTAGVVGDETIVGKQSLFKELTEVYTSSYILSFLPLVSEISPRTRIFSQNAEGVGTTRTLRSLLSSRFKRDPCSVLRVASLLSFFTRGHGQDKPPRFQLKGLILHTTYQAFFFWFSVMSTADKNKRHRAESTTLRAYRAAAIQSPSSSRGTLYNTLSI